MSNLIKPNKTYILGIGISILKINSAKDFIKSSLRNKDNIHITTPNPEIVLGSQNDEELHYIINNADLAMPDGIGLKFAAWLMKKNISRWAGSDISNWLLGLAEENNYKVSILCRNDGLSTKNDITNALKEKYPNLNFIVDAIDKEWSMPYYQNINNFKPNIVMVALGSPYQEKFIYHNSAKMPYVNVSIGVGGSFDYISGKIKPAPNLFKKLGLEWFWRLLNISSYSYPWNRVKRIMNAVIVFPLRFLKWRFVNPHVYRKNVVCLLYKIVEQSINVLLLERSDQDGHWQLPQGGTDGKSLISAGSKEIQEELSIYKFTPEFSFKNIYKYDFPIASEGIIPFKLRNYRGQSQGLLIAQFYGNDKEIKLNFWEYKAWKWVNIQDLADSVHPTRKEVTNKIIKIFNNTQNKSDKS